MNTPFFTFSCHKFKETKAKNTCLERQVQGKKKEKQTERALEITETVTRQIFSICPK